MKIIDILKSNEITISFEVFPPKTDDKYAMVEEAAASIASLHPHFMSVTYGAGGGTSKNTGNIAADIQNQFNVPMLAHLTCVSSTKEDVKRVLKEYEDKGIKNIMALRGDIPKGGRICHEYNHAIELVKDIKSIDPDICIGGACYPEGHVECERASKDLQYLKEKVDAGMDFLTTQMIFDNSTLYNFLYRARNIGIDVPILAGIMPITKPIQVKRSIEISGATIPHSFRMMVDRFGDNEEKMEKAGIIYASEQIVDLISNGVTHIHVYSMNKPSVAAGIMNNLEGLIR